jgi:hypothetical protein
MPMPTFPLAQLGAFRAALHACSTRRADALFELGDALLSTGSFPSLPHLSLEPVCRRGWGSVDAALAAGASTPSGCAPCWSAACHPPTRWCSRWT